MQVNWITLIRGFETHSMWKQVYVPPNLALYTNEIYFEM